VKEARLAPCLPEGSEVALRLPERQLWGSLRERTRVPVGGGARLQLPGLKTKKKQRKAFDYQKDNSPYRNILTRIKPFLRFDPAAELALS